MTNESNTATGTPADGLLQFVQGLQGIAATAGISLADALRAAEVLGRFRDSARMTERLSADLKALREEMLANDDDDELPQARM